MARVRPPKNANALFAELEGENDRAAILVGGTALEHALELAIEGRLREPQTDGEHRILFNEPEGILGTFSQKIWAAYFLKIIGPTVRQDIDVIRKIRNVAAHNLDPVSFENTPEIADRCRSLKMAKVATLDGKEPEVMRARFLVTVQFFTANLMMRAGATDAEIPPAYQGLASDLDR